jgi:hypothetical protein
MQFLSGLKNLKLNWFRFNINVVINVDLAENQI